MNKKAREKTAGGTNILIDQEVHSTWNYNSTKIRWISETHWEKSDLIRSGAGYQASRLASLDPS
jgi:hypothetical protein